MKSLFRFTAALVFWGLLQVRADTPFTSLYVFGDGICTTTNNYASNPSWYYGHRYCNGRVWVELLAQWQGLAYNSNQNWSFFGHYSPNLKTNVTNFVASADIGTSLVAIWVNDADFVGYLNNPAFLPYDASNLAKWTNAINQSLTNHFVAIQQLYAKGVRTLLAPNAVDLTKVPAYSGYSPAQKSFIRQRTIDFNNGYSVLLSNTAPNLPGLKIHAPDAFGLLDDVHANPGRYGFTNVTGDCIDTGYFTVSAPASGYYAFWDDTNPTAKFQLILASLFQGLVAPAKFEGASAVGTGVQLDLRGMPVGRNFVIEESTNLSDWAECQSVVCTNVNQSHVVATGRPQGFYRVQFPLLWTWP